MKIKLSEILKDEEFILRTMHFKNEKTIVIKGTIIIYLQDGRHFNTIIKTEANLEK
jgi:hypothetical protein